MIIPKIKSSTIVRIITSNGALDKNGLPRFTKFHYPEYFHVLPRQTNEIRSKQFIKIFHTADGGLEFDGAVGMPSDNGKYTWGAQVTIATSKSQVSSIYSQLGQDAGLSANLQYGSTFRRLYCPLEYLKDVLGGSGRGNRL